MLRAAAAAAAAICSIMHNDAIWLVRVASVGIEHVILYAHAPTDESQLVLAPHVASGLVMVVHGHSDRRRTP